MMLNDSERRIKKFVENHPDEDDREFLINKYQLKEIFEVQFDWRAKGYKVRLDSEKLVIEKFDADVERWKFVYDWVIDRLTVPMKVEIMKTLELPDLGKKELPDDLKESMRVFRRGFGTIPDSYIAWHEDLARKEIGYFRYFGYDVANEKLASDGWMDGMEVMHYTIVDRRTGKSYELKWNDGEQKFFVKSESGGSFPIDMEDDFKFLKEMI